MNLQDRPAREVWILSNPRAGARESAQTVDQLESRLRVRSLQVTRFDNPQDLGEALKQARPCDVRAVVMAGGDGTANLVAQLAPPDIPLIPLPLGTENLLAHYLGHRRCPESIAAAVESGPVVRYDAGECNGQLFLLMVGCGFDAEVVKQVHGARRGHIHQFTYLGPILHTIRNYRYPTLLVRYRDADLPGRPVRQWQGKWAFIVNLPRYARGLTFVPHASGTDGRLDLCLFRSGSLFKGLYYLSQVILGRHTRLSGCTLASVESVIVEVADGESETGVPWQFDGDPGGTLPIEVRVLPSRVSLIHPAGASSPDERAGLR